MKKRFIRLFALLLCAVMVLGMVPGRVGAVVLEGKKMPQTQVITYNPNMGGYYITEFVDLLQLASTAASNPAKTYSCYYNEKAPLVFFQDITLPENLQLWVYTKAVIEEDAIVEVEEYMFCKELSVKGQLIVGAGSTLQLGTSANITGAVNLLGSLRLSEDTSVIGFNRIYRTGAGAYILEDYFQTGQELQEIAEMAEINQSHWRYIACAARPDIHLSSALELPSNLTLQLYNDEMLLTGKALTLYGDLDISAGGACVIRNDLILYGDSQISGLGEGTKVTLEGDVTNHGYLSVATPVVFSGAVYNFGVLDLWHNEGATLTFQQPEHYVDMNDDSDGVICVNANGAVFPDGALVGMGSADFRYVDYHDEYDIPYWTLLSYKGIAVHTHTEKVMSAVAPTCEETGLTEGVCCSECGEILAAQEVVPALGHKEVVLGAEAATCEKTGLTEGKKCSRCGEILV